MAKPSSHQVATSCLCPGANFWPGMSLLQPTWGPLQRWSWPALSSLERCNREATHAHGAGAALFGSTGVRAQCRWAP